MEDHLYHCIYDTKQSDITPAKKLAALNRYQTKLALLQTRRMVKLMLDTNENDAIDGEEPALFHVLITMKRREERTVRRVKDQSGRIIDAPKDIANTFVAHMRGKYGPLEVGESCAARMIDAVHSCQQKSIGLKFSKSQTGSDVRYSCHHKSSCFTFSIFAHSCRFSVLHSLQSITPRIY